MKTLSSPSLSLGAAGVASIACTYIRVNTYVCIRIFSISPELFVLRSENVALKLMKETKES